MVYPDGNNEKHIYSFKKNGIKSDILLTQAPTDADNNTKTYEWDLNLSTNLEAKLLPNGGVGIYGPDLSYLTNATAGDTASQQLLDKAKQNAGNGAEKNKLIFELPAPFIVNTTNNKNYQDVSYTLDNNTLTLKATNLNNLSYPLSIDPTITVTTTSDFNLNTGDTGNIDTSTPDEIRRGSIGGGAVGSWSTTTSFGTARYRQTSVAYNGYLYMIGGWNGSNSYYATVDYAPINANGSTGTWNNTTAFNGMGRYGHTSVAYNGYLYVIGGRYGVTNYNDVQYAPINANGSLGPWNDANASGSSFTTARRDHTSVAYNGYLYVIGGGNGLNDVQYAPINANGTIGSWTTTTSFTTARYGHTSVAYNGYLYVTAGANSGSTPLSDVQYAPINANGTIGSWTSTTSLTSTRYYHKMAVYNGYMYILGGIDGCCWTQTVQYAPINANGSLGDWSSTSPFTSGPIAWYSSAVVYNGYMYISGGGKLNVSFAQLGQGTAPTTAPVGSWKGMSLEERSGSTTVAYNGYLYVIGGSLQYSGSGTSGSGTSGSILYSSISSDGNITNWYTNPTSLNTARYSHSAVAYNGYMYVIAGVVSSGFATLSVEYAPINADGTIGTWSYTTTYNSQQYRQSSVAYNGYLYVIGGYNPPCSCGLSNVYYAVINANGSLGSTWNYAGNNLPSARYFHDSAVYNGYLYVIGGVGTINSSNNVIYASINANGTINSFNNITNSLTSVRNQHTAVIYNGYMYVIGGQNGSTYYNDVQYAPLAANGNIVTSWTSATNFTNVRSGHGSFAYNGYLYVVGGYSGSSNIYYTDVQQSPIIANGAIGSWTGNNYSFRRFFNQTVAYNGYMYVLGGISSLSYTNEVQYASINASGSTTGWKVTTNLTANLDRHAAVAYNGYMYVIGGYDRVNVQYAAINADGSLGAWIDATNMTSMRYNHTTVAYNGYLYVIGGDSSGSTVQYAAINADGSLESTWRNATSLGTPRGRHTSVAYNGYLYVIGGLNTVNSTYLNDVQYTPISPNGSLGPWNDANASGSSFTTGRQGFYTVVYNGYLYVVGGLKSSLSFLSDVQHAPINANGTIGTWSLTNPLPGARAYGTSVAYNGNLYVVGGLTSGPITSAIMYTTLKSPDYKARYERVIDNGAASNKLLSFTINGSNSPCTGLGYSVSYRTAGSTNIYGSDVYIANAQSGVAQTIASGSEKRYLYVAITLNDTTCGVQSAIASIDVLYNQPPAPPTLLLPIANAVAVSTLPEFRMGTTDQDDPFIRYRIDVCTNSSCSSVLRTIDQTLSQTGWTSQSQQSGTAFPGGETITQYAVHQYQPTALTPNTTYWWRAQAIDPGGTNQWSAYSAIRQFTTDLTPAAKPTVNIKGNVNIGGNVIIKP